MKVLIVCKYKENFYDHVASFIKEQVDSLKQKGVQVDYFYLYDNGIKGYLGSRRKLIERIKKFQPDIIHAHYGLSGLLANLQRKIPVITTYHGSDINNDKAYFFSKISIALSAHNVFVSGKNKEKAKQTKKSDVIPCGVNMGLFKPLNKSEARKILGYRDDEKLILFAGSFQNNVKNPELAKKAISFFPDVNLIELKGYTRGEVSLLINAVDVVLMTSHTEGSPQFIKEAMACNCPIVSVDAGDVKEVVFEVEGCYISSYEVENIAGNLKKAFDFSGKTNGRERIKELKLANEQVADRIYNIYQSLLN